MHAAGFRQQKGSNSPRQCQTTGRTINDSKAEESLPGGPEVKILSFQCRRAGFHLWSGD